MFTWISKSKWSLADLVNWGRAPGSQVSRRGQPRRLRVEVLEDRVVPAPVHYYVGPQGNNANSGLSPSQAWKTLDKVNATTFNHPDGTIISLKRGATYSGHLFFDQTDATRTITLNSYGSGNNATIRPPANAPVGLCLAASPVGLCVSKRAGFTITDLNFDGSSTAAIGGDGIFFLDDREVGSPLTNIRIENVNVSGFQSGTSLAGRGILFVAQPGYRNVQITDADVHHNGTGIAFVATPESPMRNVRIDHMRVHHNDGNGLTLLHADGATIERSTAYENGRAASLVVGIFVAGSKNVVIQHNEAFRNRDREGFDGTGFGFTGCVSCTMQYNYSHDNDGLGYMIEGFGGDFATTNVTVRYNISENDARGAGFAAIGVYFSVSDTNIYNNTIYMSQSAAPPISGFRAGVQVLDWQGANVRFLNNIIQTTGGVPLVDVRGIAGGTGLVFRSNDYYATGAVFTIIYEGMPNSQITTIQDWRTAAGGDSRALAVNPGLRAPGQGGTVWNPDLLERALNAYKLREDSPLRQAGINLRDLGINPGSRDFYGNPLCSSFSIGAYDDNDDDD